MELKAFIKRKELDQNEMDWGSMIGISDPETCGAQNIVTIEALFKPGKGHNFHLHPRQEEVIYVLQGSLEQWVGEEKDMLSAGDAAFIPAGKVHASFNVGSEDVKILAILSPAVGAAGYEVEEVGTLAPWKDLR